MFWDKKEDKVIELMGRHFKLVEESLLLFSDFIDAYCKGIPAEDLKELSYKVHEKEHEADLVKSEIQMQLCAGAFLPFYRENFLTIPDMVDKLPGLAVKVCKEIYLTYIEPPCELGDYLKQMTVEVRHTFAAFLRMFEYIPADPDKVIELSEDVSKAEQRVDSIEWAAEVYLFKKCDKIDKADKIIFRKIITMISDIADKTENAAEYVSLSMIKMKI